MLASFQIACIMSKNITLCVTILKIIDNLLHHSVFWDTQYYSTGQLKTFLCDHSLISNEAYMQCCVFPLYECEGDKVL